MACNTCQAKFSFFTKENGCANCGFSYCSKCLKYKYNLPIGEKKICGRCFNQLKRQENTAMSTEELSIPDRLVEPLVPIDITKRMESLENPSRPPIVMYKQGGRLDQLGAGLDPADQQIVERLKRLKDEDKQLPLPTEDDIRRRLALLKDQDPDVVHPPINLNQVDTRTNQQKRDDLINEYLSRLEISKAAGEQTDSDIQARLDNLRGVDSSKYSNEPMGDDEEYDEAAATKKIIAKALSEATLESKYGDVDELQELEIEPPRSGPRCSGCKGTVQCPDGFRKNDDEYEERESCCMCEQTADLVICKGCTGDLYCPICFEDNHDDFEMHKHKTVPYKPRRMSD